MMTKVTLQGQKYATIAQLYTLIYNKDILIYESLSYLDLNFYH